MPSVPILAAGVGMVVDPWHRHHVLRILPPGRTAAML